MATTMRATRVTRAGGGLEVAEVPIPTPGPGWVRIKIEACGVCHSDSLVVEGRVPGIVYPRIPGHEVAGRIESLGPGVTGWHVGERVGAGWHGGYCGACDPCRRGELFACVTQQVTGLSFDGGYAEYMVAPTSAIARIPAELPPTDAAPLLCAGITTFNALRNSGARPGDLVAILGLGGLGHLGVQFASKMGFRTVAVARGAEKELLAKKLGAAAYIDSTAQDPAAALQSLGGAKAVVATATDGDAMSALVGGLDINGTLLVIGATMSMTINPLVLLGGRRSVKGWYSGTAIDSQDTMAFSAASGIRSMNEVFPLSEAPAAYARMMSGKARFRVVIKMAE
jgi:D-arabinose 1-dehydrogenase-like Zn-dependent alcohol dehydrogenase